MSFQFDSVTYYNTPIGMARIVGDNEGISSITVVESSEESSTSIPKCLQECVSQLEEYFYKERTSFNLKLNPQGTDFQKKVWKNLEEIPFGTTKSYKTQSEEMGAIKAIRAIAAANGKNPLWIVVPCHRVIGSNGALTGYASGLWRKRWLLEHENPPKQQSLF